MDVPVLVGLNAINRDAFETFAGGMAIQLPSEPEALKEWVDSVTAIAAVLA